MALIWKWTVTEFTGSLLLCNQCHLFLPALSLPLLLVVHIW